VAAGAAGAGRFSGEGVVDVVAALARTPRPLLFGRAGAARARALEAMVAAGGRLDRAQLGGRAAEAPVAAALFAAFAAARVGDEPLLAHLGSLVCAVLADDPQGAARVRCCPRQTPPPPPPCRRAACAARGTGAAGRPRAARWSRALRAQLTARRRRRRRHVATVLHAAASVGFYDERLLAELSAALRRTPTRAVQAREVANVAWAAAVLQSLDPALLAWVWRALDLHVAAMSAAELSQVRLLARPPAPRPARPPTCAQRVSPPPRAPAPAAGAPVHAEQPPAERDARGRLRGALRRLPRPGAGEAPEFRAAIPVKYRSNIGQTRGAAERRARARRFARRWRTRRPRRRSAGGSPSSARRARPPSSPPRDRTSPGAPEPPPGGAPG